jgi:hypothetical protein
MAKQVRIESQAADTSFYKPDAETDIEKAMRAAKSQERVKAGGEVFTPPELVNAMLDGLPQEVWGDAGRKWLEPAAGNGNFVVEVLRRQLGAGMPPKRALGNMYALEMMPDNVIMGRHRVLQLLRERDPKFSKNAQSYVDVVNKQYRSANTLESPIEDEGWWASSNEAAVPDVRVSHLRDVPELLSRESYEGFLQQVQRPARPRK